MAKYDFGLTLEEFEELTPGGLWALGKRRNVAIKYDRFANALTASAVYNVNRGDADAPVVTAFDFIRDEKDAAKRERIREAKTYIKKVIGNAPMTTPMEKFQEIRRNAIKDLQASGYDNAEDLFNEVWPHLKPAE